MKRSAGLSACRNHRYTLSRTWSDTGPLFGYFGINPSTADANIDDPTVRKWIGFTQHFGGRGFIVGNVFSYRTPNVRDLIPFANHENLTNDRHIEQIIEKVDVLVPCWGNQTKVPIDIRHHFDLLLDKLFDSGKPVKTFGLTKSGDPKHPARLGYDTTLIDMPRAK
ncbi:DUF1643 domain-containing protein [Hahella ganghwensis]|uniref:DUF1643 domain-containing protein n=1 Tax=Hahella ganghwensis TaxID=286420 RepID=UPI0004755B8F|nr:DUF1643 domain-containing protein [Hahella ganghwensis]